MRALNLLFAVLSGCMVGNVGPGPGGGTPDAASSNNGSGSGSNGGGGGGVLPDAASGTDAPANGCINAVAANLIGDGHHNPGQDCMNGCHDHGFTVAGTLFSSVSGGTAVKGATVRMLDANSQTVDVVTQLNGNFYTSQAVALPLTVLATSCPNIQHMSAQVTGASPLGCNKTGCHVAGNQIHLP
jgi:hypothetical protein